MSMDQIQALRDEIRRSLFGQAWHGPAVLGTLASFTAVEAAARPIHNAHSAWEIALHILGWIEEATSRVQGGTPGDPQRGDWPPAATPDDEPWTRVQRDIVHAHAQLDRALAVFPAARLDEPVGSVEKVPDEPDSTFGLLLHGLAQHNAYHCGQLVLLRRAVSGAS